MNKAGKIIFGGVATIILAVLFFAIYPSIFRPTGLTVTPVHISEQSTVAFSGTHDTIDVTYPQIAGLVNKKFQDVINEDIRFGIMLKVDSFKWLDQHRTSEIYCGDDFPINRFYAHYQVATLNQDFISVRINTGQCGSDKDLDPLVFNYDVRAEKRLEKIKQLFIEEEGYLPKLAAMAQAGLLAQKRPHPLFTEAELENWIKKGIAGSKGNFQFFVLGGNGLTVIPGQAKVYPATLDGAPEVTIPYSSLGDSFVYSGLFAKTPNPAPATAENFVQSIVTTGHYETKNGSLDIEKIDATKFKFNAHAEWVGNADAGQVNEGDVAGEATLHGDRAGYQDPDAANCVLQFTFTPGKVEVNDPNTACGGLNVSFTGTYQKSSAPATTTAPLSVLDYFLMLPSRYFISVSDDHGKRVSLLPERKEDHQALLDKLTRQERVEGFPPGEGNGKQAKYRIDDPDNGLAIIDTKNDYLWINPQVSYGDWSSDVSVAVFRQTNGEDVIAVESHSCVMYCSPDASYLFFLTYHDGQWTDVTDLLLPKQEIKKLLVPMLKTCSKEFFGDDKDEIKRCIDMNSAIAFTLPQKGTTIRGFAPYSLDSERPNFELRWRRYYQ